MALDILHSIAGPNPHGYIRPRVPASGTLGGKGSGVIPLKYRNI